MNILLGYTNPMFSIAKQSLLLTMFFVLCSCGTTPTKESETIVAPTGIEVLSEAQQQQFVQAAKAMEITDYLKAQKILQSLYKQQPNVHVLGFNIALCQYNLGELDAAQTSVNQLLVQDKNMAKAQNLAGLLAVKNGQFEAGKQHYLKAINVEPNYANALYNLALLYDVYLQDVQAAVNYYGKYLAIVQDDEQTQGWYEQLSSSLQ